MFDGSPEEGSAGDLEMSVTPSYLAEPSKWRFMTGTVMAGELHVVLGASHTLDLHPLGDRNPPWLFGIP